MQDFNDKQPQGSKELLREAVDQAKLATNSLASKASETAVEAKHEARRQIEAQKTEVVRQIGGVNEALRTTAASVENPRLGHQLHRLADQVEHAADKLEHAELEDMVHAAEDFSRSQPLIFLTGSFMAGLLVSRFLRATRPAPQFTLAEETKIQPTQMVSQETAHEHLVS